MVGTAVVLVHWPDDAAEVERLREQGVPRLLMVPPGEEPPVDPEPSSSTVSKV